MLDGLIQVAERELVKIWKKVNALRFDNIMLKTKTVGANTTPRDIEVVLASLPQTNPHWCGLPV
jgi:dihydrolipoamide dehydrogenase